MLLFQVILFSLIQALPQDLVEIDIAVTTQFEEGLQELQTAGPEESLQDQFVSWLKGFYGGDLGESKELREPIANKVRGSVENREDRLQELYNYPIDKDSPVKPGVIVAAIAEHNRMTKVYDIPAQGVTNQTLIINVQSEEAKKLLDKVADRTGDLIEGEVVDNES